MDVELPLRPGKIRVLATSNHQPISSFAVKIVGELGGRALIIDGTARINPYWIVRICKEYGYDIDRVLENIIIARGFTAYQLNDMVSRIEDIIKNTSDLHFLGLIDLSSRFKDDDIEKEEGIWLRSKSIKKIKRIVKIYDLYAAVADPIPEVFRKRSENEIKYDRSKSTKKVSNQEI